MKSTTVIVATALFILAWAVAGADDPPELRLPSEASSLLRVENVSSRDGKIAGTLVNKARSPIRNVKLLVQHTYRWPNEYAPGAVDPSRAETVTIDAEIPAGGSYAFTQVSQPPQPLADGGHFDTTVSALSFDRVIPAPGSAPPASPAPALP